MQLLLQMNQAVYGQPANFVKKASNVLDGQGDDERLCILALQQGMQSWHSSFHCICMPVILRVLVS